MIQHGLKDSVDHRRWTEKEIDFVREELVKQSVDEIAKKLHRTPKAVRNMLLRRGLGVKEIRCDRFSVGSLAQALHVRTDEIRYWIEQNWLQATVSTSGSRKSYIITPEALTLLYKNHLPTILGRGVRNQILFEAYLQYCFSPKHTIGEQLLDVRRDKKERAAFAAWADHQHIDDVEDEDDNNPAKEYGIAVSDTLSAMGGND